MPAPPEITPVILAGGVGRRLWPLSRETHPKPYLKFFGRRSLLQQTLARVGGFRPPVIIASQKNANLLQKQLSQIKETPGQIFLEPAGRGTAAAAAFAAHYFLGIGEDPLLLILPSDHAVRHPEALRDRIVAGAGLARQGQLVLFGLPPTCPATGFGYIKPAAGPDEQGFHPVARFVEKPDRTTAADHRRDGWLWNSGIFLFSASSYIHVLRRVAPQIYADSLAAVTHAQRRKNMVLLNARNLENCPGLSIDRAVMEQAGDRVVIPLDIGWRDLGTWPSLCKHFLGF